MQITRGYRTELDLNNEQITACKKHAGCSRFAYNWGLARKQEVYKQTGRSISAMELHRELNALKQTDFPWMYECCGHEWLPRKQEDGKAQPDPRVCPKCKSPYWNAPRKSIPTKAR